MMTIEHQHQLESRFKIDEPNSFFLKQKYLEQNMCFFAHQKKHVVSG